MSEAEAQTGAEGESYDEPQGEARDEAQGLEGRFISLAAARALGDLEAAWMDAVEEDALDADTACAVLHALADQEASKALESLLWVTLETWGESGRADQARAVVRRLAGRLPSGEVLREAAADTYRRACAGAAGPSVAAPSIRTMAGRAEDPCTCGPASVGTAVRSCTAIRSCARAMVPRTSCRGHGNRSWLILSPRQFTVTVYAGGWLASVFSKSTTRSTSPSA